MERIMAYDWPDYVRKLFIEAAVDALSHAVEAHVSRIASPMTEVHSLKAIELIVKFLPRPWRTVQWRTWKS